VFACAAEGWWIWLLFGCAESIGGEGGEGDVVSGAGGGSVFIRGGWRARAVRADGWEYWCCFWGRLKSAVSLLDEVGLEGGLGERARVEGRRKEQTPHQLNAVLPPDYVVNLICKSTRGSIHRPHHRCTTINIYSYSYTSTFLWFPCRPLLVPPSISFSLSE